jgi:hypothetical protein
MESLIKRLEEETPAELEARSLESLRWFQQRVKTLRLTSESFYRQSSLNKARRYLEGRMYTFFYDAKTKDKLPYWDRFPVVLILDLNQTGFTGLNFHYIPPKYRVRLLYELYKYIRLDDDTRDRKMKPHIRMRYEMLRGLTKMRFFKPCFKRYLTTQIDGRALEITPDYWDVMAMLPLADWQKKHAREVYTESIKIING